MSNGEHVSMDILQKICKVLNYSFGDIIEAVPDKSSE